MDYYYYEFSEERESYPYLYDPVFDALYTAGNEYARPEWRPAEPQNLRVASSIDGAIQVRWDDVPGQGYFRFYQNGVCLEDQVYRTTYTSTGLNENEVYSFQVRAVSDTGMEGEISDTLYSLPIQIAFSTPQNLHAVEVTGNAIVMAWDEASNASYYRFYVNGEFRRDVYDTSFTVRGLAEDTVYGFKVAPVDLGGRMGPYSDNVYIRTTLVQPTAPANLHMAEKTEDSITMAWDGQADAAYYRFYLNGKHISDIYGTTYTSLGLSSNTVYGFKVAAVNDVGTVGLYTDNIYIRTRLSAPQNLQAITAGDHQVSLRWEEVPGAVEYQVFVDDVLAASTKEPACELTGLASGMEHTIIVTTIDISGDLGASSDALRVEVP